MTTDTPAPEAPRPTRAVLRLALLALGLAALVVVGRLEGARLPQVAAWVKSLGPLGPLVFMATYVLACVALVPASLLTLAAGAIFGLVLGSLYVFVAAVIGSCAAFLVSRHLARGFVEARLARHPRLAALDSAVGESGFRVIALLRLSPLVPFNVLNYALGLTRVRVRDYLLASVGMIPGTILYVYSGSVAGEAATLAGGGPPRGSAHYVLLAVGLAATLVATLLATRLARKALRASTTLDR